MAEIDARPSGNVTKGNAPTLSLTVQSDGAPATVTSATVTITRADGTALYTAASAAVAAGVATKALTVTDTARVDRLKAVWAVVIGGTTYTFTSYHEVLGAQLFTLGQARAWDGGAMSDTATYPTPDILDARDRITKRFAEITGRSWVPRAAREVYSGTGLPTIDLNWPYPRSIIGVSTLDSAAVGTPFGAAALADIRLEATGRITRSALGVFTTGVDNIVVEYEHGMDSPNDATRYALMALRKELVRSNVDDRATGVTEFGIVWDLRPDPSRGRWYGIPDVDEFLQSYRASGLRSIPVV